MAATEQARRAAQAAPPAAEPADPALREELLRLAREDQQARAFLERDAGEAGDADAMVASDGLRLGRLQRIVAEGGFPRARQVARDGVAAAWLLQQHAGRDPAFQERVLAELSAREGDARVEPDTWRC